MPAHMETSLYWVHLNSKEWYATVHKAACRCCCNGNGRPKSPRNWRGPFSDYEEARIAAAGLRKHIVVCKQCRPGNGRLIT